MATTIQTHFSKNNKGNSDDFVSVVPKCNSRSNNRNRRKKSSALPQTSKVVETKLEDEHPLQSPWTLLFKKEERRRGKNFDDNCPWMDRFQKIYTCTTVENFWGMWHHSLGSPDIAAGTFTFFRDGIDPAKEHTKNYGGCALHFYVESGQEFVENLALILIGNTFDNEQVGINGIIVDIKPSKGNNTGYVWKISLWMEHDKNTSKPLIEKIKKDLKSLVKDLDPQRDIKLWNHQ